MRALGTVLSQGCVQCHPGADKSDLHLGTGRGLQPGGGLGGHLQNVWGPRVLARCQGVTSGSEATSSFQQQAQEVGGRANECRPAGGSL